MKPANARETKYCITHDSCRTYGTHATRCMYPPSRDQGYDGPNPDTSVHDRIEQPRHMDIPRAAWQPTSVSNGSKGRSGRRAQARTSFVPSTFTKALLST